MDCRDSYRLRSCQRCSTLGILVHIHPDLGRAGIVQAMHAGSALRAITTTPRNTHPPGRLSLVRLLLSTRRMLMEM